MAVNIQSADTYGSSGGGSNTRAAATTGDPSSGTCGGPTAACEFRNLRTEHHTNQTREQVLYTVLRLDMSAECCVSHLHSNFGVCLLDDCQKFVSSWTTHTITELKHSKPSMETASEIYIIIQVEDQGKVSLVLGDSKRRGAVSTDRQTEARDNCHGTFDFAFASFLVFGEDFWRHLRPSKEDCELSTAALSE